MTTKGPNMGTETIDPMLLTKNELLEVGTASKVEVPSQVKTKSDIVAVLREGGVTDAQFRSALVEAGHLEDTAPPAPNTPSDTPGDNSDNSGASNELEPAPTPPETPPAPKATTSSKAAKSEIDLDTFDPDDDLDLPEAIPGEERVQLTEADVPKLAKIAGVSVRRIKRTAAHGQGRETWWCPWTDASRLSPDDPAQLDQIDASKAIRLGRFAVVLPPQGIKASDLR